MTDQKEITCREVVEVATDYLEDELAEPLLSLLEEHLPDCDGCTEYLEQLRSTVRALGELSKTHRLDPADLEELKRVFQSWAKSSRSD